MSPPPGDSVETVRPIPSGDRADSGVDAVTMTQSGEALEALGTDRLMSSQERVLGRDPRSHSGRASDQKSGARDGGNGR